MKKISLSKIIVALVICNVYVFTCGVMGVIEKAPDIAEQPSAPVQEQLPSADGQEDELNQAHGQGTIDFLVPADESHNSGRVEQLEFMNFQTPPMEDRELFTTAQPAAEDSPELLGTYEVITPDEDEETVEVIIVTEDETEEPEVTTTTPATTTTTATTTTPATTTTTEATTTTAAPTVDPYGGGIPVEDETYEEGGNEEIPDVEVDRESAANEIVYVRNNGTVISGTALDIVAGITQTEVGNTFAPEAIKAQAVAAYTYVMYYNEHGMYPSVAVSSNVTPAVRTLVESVIGDAVYYNGGYIQSVYSASSAGYTASSKCVWGNDYPYLISKYCELDEKYDPNYGRTATFTSAEISDYVYNVTGIELTGDPSLWISVEDYVEGRYVGQMNIGGYHSYTDSDGDSVKITGRVFREKIMDFNIRSHAFDISYDAGSDTFTVTTYGYGHGVGMSQNGANALATYWGFDYKEILTYYYVGCEVY